MVRKPFEPAKFGRLWGLTGLQGLGFRVLGFRVWGLGSRV